MKPTGRYEGRIGSVYSQGEGDLAGRKDQGTGLQRHKEGAVEMGIRLDQGGCKGRGKRSVQPCPVAVGQGEGQGEGTGS